MRSLMITYFNCRNDFWHHIVFCYFKLDCLKPVYLHCPTLLKCNHKFFLCNLRIQNALDIYLFNLHVHFNETCCLDLQYIYV